MLKGKKIVIGVTGSIAAYKIPFLVRLLVREEAQVRVIMTPAAAKFVTPLTLSTLSRSPVIIDPFKESTGEWNNHVELGTWADLMIFAPVTANTLGKMAHGVADNFLVTAYLSARCPVFIAPAMDLDMYNHPSTKKNIQTLLSYGNTIIEPQTGELASGLSGPGRMEEPEKILEQIRFFFDRLQQLSGLKILVTAGPTYESIDAVRFIGNRSSGQMGVCIAEEASRRGAAVTLISGPGKIKPAAAAIRTVNVFTASEMHRACMDHLPSSDIVIMAAAVADYTPAKVFPGKIKKTGQKLTLDLVKTTDILEEMGRNKKKNQTLVGFALEAGEGVANAEEKLRKKNLDLVILNSLQEKGAGFDVPTNKISIIGRSGTVLKGELKDKRDVASDILDAIVKLKDPKKPALPKKKCDTMKKFILLIALFLMMFRTVGQELDCQVSVSSPQLAGTDKRVFETMQGAIFEFMNNRKWTTYAFKMEERIECTILITINDRPGTDDFRGTLNIVLRRPVYNSAYNSPLLNTVDKDFQFRYVEFQPLDYSEGTYTSNLTSTLAFYANVFLGVYFDSFSPYGGSPFLQKAQEIVNAAQNATETGWRGYESDKNKFWLVENLLNPSNSELRDFSYKFHRLGLDQMYDKLEQGRTAVTESLDLLKTIYDEKPGLYGLQLILDAKRDEFVNIYSNDRVPPLEKTSVVNILKEIDPANGSKYQTILSGK